MIETIKRRFETIEDRRHPSYIEHKLSDVLTIVFCAVLVGMDELCNIITYARAKANFFKTKFNIKKIPSKPTLSRILNMIDGKAVGKIMVDIMRENYDINLWKKSCNAINDIR